MKYLIAITTIISLLFSFAKAQNTVTITNAFDPTAKFVLVDGTPVTGGFGIVGTFINLDNTTPTPVSDIQANFTSYSWMSSRFRAFGAGAALNTVPSTPITSGDPDSTSLIDADFTSAGPATPFNYGNATTSLIYLWVFSGAVPTSQAAYDALQTGIFAGNVTFGEHLLPNNTAIGENAKSISMFGSLSPVRIVSSNTGNLYGLVAVPEPSTVALALLGAAGVLIARRRRK